MLPQPAGQPSGPQLQFYTAAILPPHLPHPMLFTLQNNRTVFIFSRHTRGREITVPFAAPGKRTWGMPPPRPMLGKGWAKAEGLYKLHLNRAAQGREPDASASAERFENLCLSH